jgi:DNA polymerase (family 10)
MMQIKGLGPKKIATIWKEMGIESLGELLYACNENRLLLYKGFGEKTQESVKQAIQFYNSHKGQFLYAEIEAYALQLESAFLQQFPEFQTSLSGEIKRQSIIITQIDLLTTAPAANIVAFFNQAGFNAVQAEGELVKAQSPDGAQIVVTMSAPEQYVARLFISTCSGLFLQQLTNQYGFLPDQPYASEQAIFESLGIHYLPANQRELAELIRPLSAPTPEEPVQPDSIRAVIHSHSNWSDGLNSLETMANACISAGMEYMVISDHSRSAFYANGLSVERIREQHLQIDELNRKLAPFTIFKSIECDILGDGSLDYDDDTLASFDLVIASVHSNLKMTEEKAMQRLLRAIEHPATCILGHMTGRLLLSRPGYPVNHQVIIDACVANGVAIEINAHPRRLDIDWSWIPYAMEKGCLLSINPDAHSVDGYQDIRYGVLAAQKGGLTTKHNLSSYSLEQFKTWLRERKQRR